MNALVIALFAALAIRAATPEWPHVFAHEPAAPWWLLAIVPMLAIAVFVDVVLRIQARRVDRTGSWEHIEFAERVLAASRWAVVVLNAVNVLELGIVEHFRESLSPLMFFAPAGPLTLLAEVLTLALPLAVVIMGWWSFYPIERRLRDAVILRSLDHGHQIYQVPTRARWVVMNIRHQMLLSILPLALIAAWSQGAKWLIATITHHAGESSRLGRFATFASGSEARATLLMGLQILGMAAIFACVPIVMARVWDTIRLGPGPMRDRLIAMCKDEHVRVREILVWRTFGTMVNGAVMGLLAPMRYILLTDALLDQLPERQVEAVMAHELAHVKRAHLPWLAATLIVAVGCVALLFDLMVMATGPWSTSAMQSLEVFTSIGALAAGISVFGYVSRRFEWQADAFAVQHLSKRTDAPERWLGIRISPEAVADMAGALETVTRLNHLPRAKNSWRHGSIQHRQQRLAAISGLDIDHLPIDRTVRRLKWATILGVAILIGAEVLSGVTGGWSDSDSGTGVPPGSAAADESLTRNSPSTEESTTFLPAPAPGPRP